MRRWRKRILVESLPAKTIDICSAAERERRPLRNRFRYLSPESFRQEMPKTRPCWYLSRSRKNFRVIPANFGIFSSARLTKPADALSVRDPQSLTPTEYDRWFCSPYISSISYQIGNAMPGVDVRAIRRVADTEGRILSRISTLLWIVTLAALIAAALAVAATSATTVLERRAEVGVMKALGAPNANRRRNFSGRTAFARYSGRGGWLSLLGHFARARAGPERIWNPGSPRMILFPIVIGDCSGRCDSRQLDSIAARRAFRACGDFAGRVMFWRIVVTNVAREPRAFGCCADCAW